MSCILRFWGKDFNPQKAIEGVPLAADKLWLVGERRFPESTKALNLNKSSGVNFLVSAAEFSELPLQIEHATSFLATHHSWLVCLSSAPGLEGAVIDFGAEINNPFSQSYSFPPALLTALGKANITLGLSIYPYDDATEDA
ncbi:hypothetical protein IB234_23725 [Pseudomonas sp. PDM16]|uniref:hypothetical protein n=1 Tax=Pseudomonas sp. PDM16 TaxID=2769292 RepID=UPI00178193C1|nr:hypothetical protein [Pseudomonas sp. PDM16]MBD9417578.1 hypothetical protein [Pseudomonas sp. PDM16]